MIADQHSLLEERGVGARVVELSALLVAHVIDLTVGLGVGVIARHSAATRKARFGNLVRRL